jgi:hypothetical protein
VRRSVNLSAFGGPSASKAGAGKLPVSPEACVTICLRYCSAIATALRAVARKFVHERKVLRDNELGDCCPRLSVHVHGQMFTAKPRNHAIKPCEERSCGRAFSRDWGSLSSTGRGQNLQKEEPRKVDMLTGRWLRIGVRWRRVGHQGLGPSRSRLEAPEPLSFSCSEPSGECHSAGRW